MNLRWEFSWKVIIAFEFILTVFPANSRRYNQAKGAKSSDSLITPPFQETSDLNDKIPLLDKSTGKWHYFGSRGPCGLNMIFYRNPTYPQYGFCDCDQGLKSKSPCSDHPVRRMIYIPKMNQCLPIFSQGPCEATHWLNLDNDSEPVCEPNRCRFNQDDDYQTSLSGASESVHQFWYYDPLRKSCFQTLTRGYCPVGFTLEVVHDSHIPKCRRKLCYGKLTNFRSALKCKSGSRYSYLLRGCSEKSKSLRYTHIFG